ncbi:MAG TPA: threonine ammonia-lyase, biosynthetic [Casimicrobiaceae bacterium]|nr:threonine ammonia-lyase, biosynthetic [Casimicrobiaceae bacterium]
MAVDYLKKILTAKVYDVAVETPLELAPALSRRLGSRVLLKREDQQSVFSFKLRGAYNKMVHLSAAARARGVIAASAGNHAQGVALAAQRLRCRATIVMPVTTPHIKIAAVEARGAKVVLHGDSYSDAYAYALARQKRSGATFVHPYDDPDVIAGQGTIGMEILRQWQGPLDAIFVAIGGGGLIGGIAAYVKRVRPEVRIIGVQPEDSDAMARSLAAGRRVLLPHVGLFADGVAVRQVGRETFRLARRFVDEVIRVDTDAICAALKDVFEDTRAILEPSGALSVAGVKVWAARENAKGRTVAAVACGANMNFDRLRFVAERAELGEQREAILAVSIPERPGSFREFCALLGKRSVTEFNYRYADPKVAHLFVGVEVADRRETDRLLAALARRRIRALDLSDNEMAKLHVRHLVGGHAPSAEHEILYRFEFPERPGALMRFLSSMSAGWNISLFHYRNHGADYGRVLVGMQVPPQDKAQFKRFLDRLGYDCVDESANPAYRLFLGR